MEEDTQNFGCIMLCYFKKGKNKTGMQQKDCAGVWRRCCDWSNVPKVVCIHAVTKGTGEHYAKWNKPGGKGQIPYDLTFNGT